MCGIVGYVGSEPAAHLLIEGLEKLSYRGYDSSGIATLHNRHFHRVRAKGKLEKLKEKLEGQENLATIGIAHTRWATHGMPTEANAHPHQNDKVSLVHNGIIENADSLKKMLLQQGYEFESETDTEVIAHLLHYHLTQGLNPQQALQKLQETLRGAYALGILFAQDLNRIYIMRHGSPLVVGRGETGHFIGSDALALGEWCQQFCYLENGDFGWIEQGRLSLWNEAGEPCERSFQHVSVVSENQSKEGYPYFMAKEIHEQPQVIRQTLSAYLDFETFGIKEDFAALKSQGYKRVQIVGCGTAFLAGRLGKYWLEGIAGLPTSVEIASEFRYCQKPIETDTLYLFISQSGETADTLAAHEIVKAVGAPTGAIVNVPHSTLDREVDLSLYTYAGAEIGVASTKAFTAQLCALYALSLCLAPDHKKLKEHFEVLKSLPGLVQQTVDRIEKEAPRIAMDLAKTEDMLFIGRHTLYPIALEGALKMKELSYVHAEGYGAGELKHGPIALIHAGFPTIALLDESALKEKTLSNVQEVQARGGPLYGLVSEGALTAEQEASFKDILYLPKTSEEVSPFLMTIAVQWLAYFTAMVRGNDIDQPRNLAKSVTVE